MRKMMIICPSRGRPDRCLEMAKSFRATSSIACLKVLIDFDDPLINEYDKVGQYASIIKDFRKTTTERINDSWKGASECFKFFGVTNDDFIYRTDRWDEMLLASLDAFGGSGIAYGNDLLQGIRIPTTSLISRDIIEALGWLQMPRLIHLYGDNVWAHIGNRVGCLLYRQDVIIEHRHFHAGKSVEDETYKRTNSSKMYDDDRANFIKWLYNECRDDIEKVKGVVEKTRLFIRNQ